MNPQIVGAPALDKQEPAIWLDEFDALTSKGPRRIRRYAVIRFDPEIADFKVVELDTDAGEAKPFALALSIPAGEINRSTGKIEHWSGTTVERLEYIADVSDAAPMPEQTSHFLANVGGEMLDDLRSHLEEGEAQAVKRSTFGKYAMKQRS